MKKNHVQQYQSGNEKKDSEKVFSNGEISERQEVQEIQEIKEVVPGVLIVRSNTPRPLSFEAMISSSGQLHSSQQEEIGSAFPAIAPSAPPLPEEASSPLPERVVVGAEDGGSMSGIAPSTHSKSLDEEGQDSIWLFEYGLEMDAAILNSAERLDGHAIPGGAAVVRGYTIMLGAQRIHSGTGPTVVAMVSSAEQGAGVWGVLYRVPRSLGERNGDDPSLLDTIHAAIEPQNFFKGVQLVVHDTRRNRDVECVAYVATDIACKQLHLVSVEQWSGDAMFVQRLASIARKQKLPESYVRQYGVSMEGSRALQIPSMMPPPPSVLPESLPEDEPIIRPGRREQITEPLPAFKGEELASGDQTPKLLMPVAVIASQRWLVVFATYLVALLLLVLVFSIVQGMGWGSGVFTNHFLLLGVPWLVMMYGLLGGCMSCIVSLRTFRTENPPIFIIITWFTRPFIGALLAIFAYLLLTSGFFVLGDNVERHMPFFLLIAAVAGFCEGWIFSLQNESN